MSTCAVSNETIKEGINKYIDANLDPKVFTKVEGYYHVQDSQSNFQGQVDAINEAFKEPILVRTNSVTDVFSTVEPSESLIKRYISSSKDGVFLSAVQYKLKALDILQSDRADEIFRKGDKYGWDVPKMLTELAVPKQQQGIILSFNTRNREEIVANLLANYSYTVEINIAKISDASQYNEEGELSEPTGETYPTGYYSNMTVPGGTNYTENEIATPAITPSIKGHAQFATDNGIGWFRSDDRLAEDTKTDNIDGTITDYTGYNVNKIPSGYTIYNKNRGWLRDATGKPLDFKTEKEASDYLNKLINQGITNNSSIITKNDKIIFGHPTIGKSYLKQKGNNDFITLDDDYADEVNAFIDANRGSETRQEYKGRKPKEYNEFMLNLFDRLKLQAKKEGKRLFVSNTNILKERMSDFDKVITIPKDEFKKRFDARGSTYGFEDWKSDIDATVAKVDKSKVISTRGYLSDLLEGNPKTRRILELQSDLFQKGRLKEDLILSQNEDNVYNAKKEDSTREEFWIAKEKGKQVSLYNNTFYEYNGYYYDFLSFSDKYYKIEKNSKIDTSENQFLQLLNKDNNWVTFFVKSIIQDTAKQTVTEVQESDVEAKVRELEKEGLLEIDCKGKLKAEKGLATSFVKGGKWKVIKDLKGYPTHKEGGVDLTIGKGGVSIKNGNTQFTAKYGLVIPKN